MDCFIIKVAKCLHYSYWFVNLENWEENLTIAICFVLYRIVHSMIIKTIKIAFALINSSNEMKALQQQKLHKSIETFNG